MFAKFDLEKWKKLPIKDKPESIFDITYAGQVAEDGKYYCILWSYEKNSIMLCLELHIMQSLKHGAIH